MTPWQFLRIIRDEASLVESLAMGYDYTSLAECIPVVTRMATIPLRLIDIPYGVVPLNLVRFDSGHLLDKNNNRSPSLHRNATSCIRIVIFH